MLGNAGESEAKEWAERYRAHPAYGSYLSASPKDKGPGILLEERPLARMREKQVVQSAAPIAHKVSSLGQFLALSARNLKVLLRDRFALFLIFVAPLLAVVLDLVFADRNMYDPASGSSEKIFLSSAVLVFLVMLFAGFSWAREFRREAVVFKHERRTALKLLPYVLSKLWIVSLFALYQALVWTGIHFLIVIFPDIFYPPIYFYITLASVALLGGILGLLASTLASSMGGAAALVFAFALPQFFFSGGLRQISQPDRQLPALKWVNPSRAATEALVIAGGHGLALSHDPCLKLPLETREALTDGQKASCTCLGANMLNSCYFPGILQFKGPELDEPPLESPVSFQGLLERFQGKSDADLPGEVEALSINLNEYVRAEVDRETAIRGAENLIKSEYDRYQEVFNEQIPTGNWTALWISTLVLTVIFAIVLKGKDVR
jgi:hypothetical protein